MDKLKFQVHSNEFCLIHEKLLIKCIKLFESAKYFGWKNQIFSLLIVYRYINLVNPTKFLLNQANFSMSALNKKIISRADKYVEDVEIEVKWEKYFI